MPYLLLILYAPFVPLPTTTKHPCRTKIFFLLVISTAAIIISAQLVHQIALRFNQPRIVDYIRDISAFIGIEKLYIDRCILKFSPFRLQFFFIYFSLFDSKSQIKLEQLLFFIRCCAMFFGVVLPSFFQEYGRQTHRFSIINIYDRPNR